MSSTSSDDSESGEQENEEERKSSSDSSSSEQDSDSQDQDQIIYEKSSTTSGKSSKQKSISDAFAQKSISSFNYPVQRSQLSISDYNTKRVLGDIKKQQNLNKPFVERQQSKSAISSYEDYSSQNTNYYISEASDLPFNNTLFLEKRDGVDKIKRPNDQQLQKMTIEEQLHWAYQNSKQNMENERIQIIKNQNVEPEIEGGQFFFRKQGIVLKNDFEGANLRHCQLTDFDPLAKKVNISIWLVTDVDMKKKFDLKQVLDKGVQYWFYFSIEGVQNQYTITFRIKNYNREVARQYFDKQKAVPVIRYESREMLEKEQNEENLKKYTKKDPFNFENSPWIKVHKDSTEVYYSPGKCEVRIHFKVDHNKIKFFDRERAKIYFAFSEPYLYTTFQQKIDDWKKYIKKQKLSQFLKFDFKDDFVIIRKNDYFDEALKKAAKQLGQNVERPLILITSGLKGVADAPASLAIEGIIQEIFQKNELLNNFDFLIYPYMNKEGHVNADNEGNDLRKWLDKSDKNGIPSFKSNLQKEIYEKLTNVIQKMKEKTIKVDKYPIIHHFHFTSSVERPGIHMKGEFSDSLNVQAERMILPKILSFNSLFFNFPNCKFRDHKIIEKTKETKFVHNIATQIEETFIDFPHFMSKYFQNLIESQHKTFVFQFHYQQMENTNDIPTYSKMTKMIEYIEEEIESYQNSSVRSSSQQSVTTASTVNNQSLKIDGSSSKASSVSSKISNRKPRLVKRQRQLDDISEESDASQVNSPAGSFSIKGSNQQSSPTSQAPSDSKKNLSQKRLTPKSNRKKSSKKSSKKSNTPKSSLKKPEQNPPAPSRVKPLGVRNRDPKRRQQEIDSESSSSSNSDSESSEEYKEGGDKKSSSGSESSSSSEYDENEIFGDKSNSSHEIDLKKLEESEVKSSKKSEVVESVKSKRSKKQKSPESLNESESEREDIDAISSVQSSKKPSQHSSKHSQKNSKVTSHQSQSSPEHSQKSSQNPSHKFKQLIQQFNFELPSSKSSNQNSKISYSLRSNEHNINNPISSNSSTVYGIDSSSHAPSSIRGSIAQTSSQSSSSSGIRSLNTSNRAVAMRKNRGVVKYVVGEEMEDDVYMQADFKTMQKSEYLYPQNFRNFGHTFVNSLLDLFEISQFIRKSRLYKTWCKGEVRYIKASIINTLEENESWWTKMKMQKYQKATWMSKFKGKPGQEIYVGEESGESDISSGQDSEREYEKDPLRDTLVSRIYKDSENKMNARAKRRITNKVNRQQHEGTGEDEKIENKLYF